MSAEQFVYVPVTSTSIQLGLYVTGAGYRCVAPGSEYPQKGHPELYDFTWRSGRVLPEFQFVFIAAGSGEFETKDSGTLAVNAGSMLILQPDVWHRYRPRTAEGWTEFWISVNGDLIHDWQQRGLLESVEPVIQLATPDQLISEYRAIIDELKAHPRHQPARVSARALMIMTSVMDHREPTGPATLLPHGQEFGPIVRAAINEIWNYSHHQISVAAIARRINVVRRTLERVFMKETGHSVHTELMKCRLERARRLLAETQVPIKAVAVASGFSSVSNMSRVFRRELQQSPTEYREVALASTTQAMARRTRVE